MSRRGALICRGARALALLVPLCGFAHVGSPQVYADSQAGPYRLFVTIDPPNVIPGVAQVAVRASEPGVDRITAAPLGLVGAAAQHSPVPDELQRSANDPNFFTGAVWLMQSGSSQVKLVAHGSKGDGAAAVPVPAVALGTTQMQPALGVLLIGLALLLAIGVAAIAGAAVRDARLEPGAVAASSLVLRGRTVTVVALCFAVLTLIGAKAWWSSIATDYGHYIYKPLTVTAALESGNVLRLRLSDPGWLKFRKVDDFTLDHGHVMHLWMFRSPGLDVMYHLHPMPSQPGEYTLELPSIAAGNYKLFADVVHENGLPETLTASINLPEISGRALTGDDSAAKSTAASAATPNRSFNLPDGYRMIFEAPDEIRDHDPRLFRFKLLDSSGSPASDVGLYMGMLGHAAIVKADGSVFAHIHPNGSAPMYSIMLAQPEVAKDSMPGMVHGSKNAVPAEVTFPYGFPATGRYRWFVQMKHAGVIETGVFDVAVGPSLIS